MNTIIMDGLEYEFHEKGQYFIVSKYLSGKDITITESIQVNEEAFLVEEIAENVFKDSLEVESVMLPKTLKNVKPRVFAGCINLKKAEVNCDISHAVGIFQDCTSLKFVHLKDTETIPADAFNNCSSLEAFIIPPTTEKIFARAFKGTKLSAITIPASVQDINEGAFSIEGLFEVIIQPADKEVLIISEKAFEDCTSLHVIYLPLSVKKVENFAFLGTSLKEIKCAAKEKPAKWESYWNHVITDIPTEPGVSEDEGHEGVPVIWNA